MEIEHSHSSLPIFKGIIEQCDPRLQLCFLQFLQTQIIVNIALLGRQYKKQSYFYRLANVVIYFKKYLNRVDRSMYYLFYEEKSFVPLEQTFIINIAENQATIFYQLTNSYQTSLAQLIKQSECVSNKQQLQNLIQEIFFQTDYPLPGCKRQTIGVYCESPFQNFMSTIRFPTTQAPDQFIEPPLQEMRKYFLQEMQTQKIIELIHEKGHENISKMTLLRFCPHQLKFLNIQQQLIENFQLHNIIVTLYKLVATNAEASYTIVKQHIDPIMRMAQFVTRANIYKNMILAIEQKFSFLFQSYQGIFEIVSKQQTLNILPKFQFWNGAMSIWIQQFKGLNDQLYESFNYILLREREAKAMQFLSEKSEIFPSVYNTVKLQLQQKSLFDQRRLSTYNGAGISYEEFFEQNIDSFEILAKDFVEHQVDMSINEVNVHKCGHSEHAIKRIPFFSQFVQTVKKNSQLFYSHLQNVVFNKNSDNKMRINLLKELIKTDLDFINDNFTKPVILKQVLASAQGLIESLVQKLPQFAVFTEEALQKFRLHFDFNHKDNLLDYFSTKSQTPNDCNEKYRCFFDAYKDKSIEDILYLAMNIKNEPEMIDSEIEEECYESSLSNSSALSMEEE